MQVGVIGASGNIGQRVAQEAIDRGHEVIGFSRDPVQARQTGLAANWEAMDVLDALGDRPLESGIRVRRAQKEVRGWRELEVRGEGSRELELSR
jgi:nucleoside-diphosphate-sugar epimerase